MLRFIIAAIVTLGLVAPYAAPVSAWGGTGHILISRAGATAFPDTLPAFLRTPAAIDEIAELGPELDRSKDAGASHDRDRDTGHFADIGDDGKIFGIDLGALPPNREAYDTALRAAGSDQYRAGFLPYSLIDGWQQVAKDFACWRIDVAGEKLAKSADDKAWFARDRALWELLSIRDVGVWSHYVGDASQPLHVTVHYNGWGDYPNPNGFTTSKTLHADFEGKFVREHATLAAVTAHMHPLAASNAPIAQLVDTYLTATVTDVIPLYQIEKRGGFAAASPEAVDFVDARLADGASELRDLVVDAWSASSNVKVGYPHQITPAEVDAGTAIPMRGTADVSD